MNDQKKPPARQWPAPPTGPEESGIAGYAEQKPQATFGLNEATARHAACRTLEVPELNRRATEERRTAGAKSGETLPPRSRIQPPTKIQEEKT